MMIPAEDLLKGFKNSLVTGATGFIGTNLVEMLTEKGVMVRVLFRKGSRIKLLDELAVEGYSGDLLNEEILMQAISDSTTVYNLAAETRDSLRYSEYKVVNVTGLRNLLEISNRNHAKKVVHVSTAEVCHANQPAYPIREDHPTDPRTPFQRSKEAAEKMALKYYRANSQLDITVIRPCLTIGPRDARFSEVLLDMIYEGDVNIPGDGTSLMSIIYVKDLVNGLHIIANSDATSGEIFHAKSFDATLTDLILALGEAAGIKPKIHTTRPAIARLARIVSRYAREFKKRKKDPKVLKYSSLTASPVVDDTKFRSIGYLPEYSLEKAAETLVKWYRGKKRSSGARV